MSSNYSCCGLTGKQKQEEIVGKENKKRTGREREECKEKAVSHMNTGMRFIDTHSAAEGVKLLPVKQKESDRTTVS